MKKELSVLIPIYNCDCRNQVKALAQQAQLIAGLDYEIIIANDASPLEEVKAWCSELDQLPHVQIIHLTENHGRAAIRNLLAQKAQYEWLLFMDGDMAIPSDTFVKNWIEAEVPQVAYGGYIVGPGDCSSLRYIYEKQCEPMHRVEERKKRPQQHFHTCNFMINRTIMQENPFDERFRSYGYEDVFFGKQLLKAGVKITHIDNPAGFFDFEDNAHFVSKTEEGLRTLLAFRNDLRGYSQMLTFVDGIHLFIVRFTIRLWHRIFGKIERRQLCSNRPSLKVFRIYKLGYFLCAEKER